MRLRNCLLLFLLCLLLASCRIIQHSSVGGAIVSADASQDCAQAECIVDVSGPLNQSYTAVPDPGYEFVTWQWLCEHEAGPDCSLDIAASFTAFDIDVPQVALFAPIPADNLATERVVLDTNHGYIVVELYGNASPVTVANFINYVESHFYEGTLFHRVVPGFVIQGGGFTFTADGDYIQKETNGPIRNEASNRLQNLRGTIAMARLSDPDTATAQFFINLADNHDLDYQHFGEQGYAVFGRVVTGMEVVDTIGAYRTLPGGTRAPRTIVTINRITRHGPPGPRPAQ